MERLPGLASRLRVSMLPTLGLVEKGNLFHSVIGFDEMGGGDGFRTEALGRVLGRYGMINVKGMFFRDGEGAEEEGEEEE